MKHSSYASLERVAPGNYDKNTTAEALRSGLARVAPPGKTPAEDVVINYDKNTTGKGGHWLKQWVTKMFR